MARRKQYITKEESAYWTVIDRKDGNANWPFLPLFTSFSMAFAEAQRKNEEDAKATGRPKFMHARFITSRLLFPNP